MRTNKIIFKVIKGITPYGFFRAAELFRKKMEKNKHQKKLKPFVGDNYIFKNIHKNKRCFILGCGPSINSQDLKCLKDEISISVNLFYLHKDYSLIRPKYHLYSGLANHPEVPLDVGLKLYKEMEEKLEADFVFLNYKDNQFISKNNLFHNKKNVRFVDYTASLDEIFQKNINLTESIYKVYNVVSVALQIAIYMGFSEIYLMGVDHDWILRFKDRIPTHFYKPDDYLSKENIPEWGGVNWEEQFWLNLELWRQYKTLKKFCDLQNIRIHNASSGGILDVFPRIEYESLF